MNLYIHENQSTLGPFDEVTIIEKLRTGQVSVRAMACPVGQSQWMPLREVISLPTDLVLQAPPPAPTELDGTGFSAERMLSRVAGGITDFAGVEKLDGFEPRNFFSAVFKKRTAEEIETYFSVGSPETSPPLDRVDCTWPRPWFFARAFIFALLTFIGTYYLVAHFENPVAIPAVLMSGAFAVPCSILILFFEMNVVRNISLYQMIKLTLIGGVLSLLAAMFLSGWASGIGLDWMGASVAGLVEEPAKVLAMLIVANNTRYRWTLNGLLIGACIGTGFAVVETAGYAFVGLIRDMQGEGMVTEGTLFLRALLYPLGGHAILSAITGAALWRVKGDAKFQWEMLKSRSFLRLFVVSVAAHIIWNSPLELPFFGKYLIIGAVLWLIVLALVQDGLKQIASAQKTNEEPKLSEECEPVAAA